MTRDERRNAPGADGRGLRAAGALRAVLFCAALCVLAVLPARAGQAVVEAKKKSLADINAQLEEKKAELEKYRQEEQRISDELSGLKKEEKLTAVHRRDLESQLEKAKARTGDARLKYDSLERSRKDLTGDIHGELVMLSLQKEFYYPYYGIRDIDKDMLMRYAVLKKRALLSSMKGESLRVHRDMESLIQKGAELRSRQALLRRQSSANKTALKAKRSELEKTREEQARLSDELQSLQEAALGLTRLVKKLQKQAPYISSDFNANLPIPRDAMSWPAMGKVISRFGRENVPGLKTWIVREGIRIATGEDAPVRAALAGKVIYAGPFRTYGNVVIVDHEKGFFTIYGLLSRIDASRGEEVTPATQLGLAGKDTQAMSTGNKAPGSAVYFEIRKGDRAINPLKWLPDRMERAPSAKN